MVDERSIPVAGRPDRQGHNFGNDPRGGSLIGYMHNEEWGTRTPDDPPGDKLCTASIVDNCYRRDGPFDGNYRNM